jgi:prepilin-type N-terminal cleavage/methylation domain-containing protein
MRKSKSGFSMIELLVVVTIILVLVTGSISIMSVFMRGQGIKQSGRVIQGQFMNARQKATSEKTVYYLVFDTQKQVMRMYRDVDPDGPTAPKTYDRLFQLTGVDKDQLEGDEHPLPNRIEFGCAQTWVVPSIATKCMTSTAPFNIAGSSFWISFYPDGTCVLPAAEKTYDPDTGGTADLILVQNGQTNKLFMDLNPASGKVRKQAYRTQ